MARAPHRLEVDASVPGQVDAHDEGGNHRQEDGRVPGLQPRLQPGRTRAGHPGSGGVQSIPARRTSAAARRLSAVSAAGIRASRPTTTEAVGTGPAAASATAEHAASRTTLESARIRDISLRQQPGCISWGQLLRGCSRSTWGRIAVRPERAGQPDRKGGCAGQDRGVHSHLDDASWPGRVGETGLRVQPHHRCGGLSDPRLVLDIRAAQGPLQKRGRARQNRCNSTPTCRSTARSVAPGEGEERLHRACGTGVRSALRVACRARQ
jgi:hypothetical protein